MIAIDESCWLDVSTPADELNQSQRLVKTLSVSTRGISRVLRIEIETERSLGEPPDNVLTEWLYDWLEDGL